MVCSARVLSLTSESGRGKLSSGAATLIVEERASVEPEACGEDVIHRGRPGGGGEAVKTLGGLSDGVDKVSSDAPNVAGPLESPDVRGRCSSVVE